jgi:hypothetical protein
MSRPQNNPGTVDLTPAWGWILGTLVPALLENGTSEGKEDALKLLGEAGSKLDLTSNRNHWQGSLLDFGFLPFYYRV